MNRSVNGWLVAAGGVWMIIAPWVGMANYGNAWNDWIMGVVFAVLGFAMVTLKPAPGWITVLGGIWLFIAGWIPALLVNPDLAWNDVLVGIGAVIVGIWATTIRTGRATMSSSNDIRRAA